VFSKLLVSAYLVSLFVTVHISAQQVAFIGDDLTYRWQQTPQFQAHKNWLPYGVNIPWHPSAGNGTNVALTQLQAILRSGQKPMIHLLVGQADEDGIDAGGNQSALIFAVFATNMEQIIATAQAAKLKIVVGTIPYSAKGDLGPLNQWIFQYCNAHNVSVINYAFALNSGKGFAANHGSSQYPAPVYYNPAPDPQAPLTEPSLTSAGYDLITDMAATQIGLTEGTFRLTGGYLNTITLDDLEDAQPVLNGNTLVDAGTVQFTPYGEYSDGNTRILNNADQYGHVGVWTSSAPSVVSLDAYGAGTAFRKGSANVHFVSNTGMAVSEWTMFVNVLDPTGGSYSSY
jgi:hypothetical protein